MGPTRWIAAVAWVCACEGVAPAASDEPPGVAAPDEVREGRPAVSSSRPAARPASPAPAVDSRLVDRYPSLEYYPAIEPPLRAALERGADAREVLAALEANLAPHRWPGMFDWDRHGFISLAGALQGHVTRISGELVRQPVDRHDLGCAGGFLEGVRLTLLPRLGIDELDRCGDELGRVQGAPARCDPDHEYGLLALANIAARLDERRLPAGARLLELDVADAASLDGLFASRSMSLCTVSHVSGAYDRARYYHHMMIVLGTPDGDSLDVFDTTGGRGVSLLRMPRSRFVRYLTVMLRSNREFRYLGRGTGLTCLPVARGVGVDPP